jgi:glutamine amidotransferase
VCRHLAWIGRPRTLASLILDPPHGLLHQSYAPRQQQHGRINADGFGVGWYAPDARSEPARYRRAQPIWTDASFASFAGVVSSSVVLAAVRSATAPFPIDEAGAAPFTAGPWLFSLNGAVANFGTAALELRSRLPATATSAVEGPSDAALLWSLLRHRLDLGQPLADALTAVVADAVAAGGGRLNLLATDGQTVAATTYGDTLFTRREADGVLVVSEPSDDLPGWEQVPDRCLVVATSERVDVSSLPTHVAAPVGDRT